MMKLKALAAFCRRMGVGLRSGVEILRLLETESKSGDPRHRKVMLAVSESIRGGSTLAKAMIEQKQYFPPLLIQMVHASELGGRIEAMFAYMASYYEDLKNTRTFLVGKITWPLIQLCMAIGIIGLMILLQGFLFANSDYDMTGLGLRGVPGFLTYCLVVFGFIGFCGLLGYGVWKNWLGCHQILVPLVQRIPVLGSAFVTLGLSRLSMTLSMLLNAGVEAQRSIKQAYLATGNHYFISGMQRAVDAVGRGASFGDAFDESKVLPDDFVDMVRAGELSGTETESLDHLAEQYRDQAKSALSTIATLASIAIGFGTLLLIAFMVLRIALQVFGVYYDAIEELGTLLPIG